MALAGRRALLVLDNFEQLVDAAGDLVSALLSRLPLLQVLATSRRALGLDGEHQFAMPELPLPEAGADPALAADNPAVALFADRARAARADFQLGPAAAGARHRAGAGAGRPAPGHRTGRFACAHAGAG